MQKKRGADITNLKETHSTIETEDKWGKEWEWGKSIWNSANSRTAGTAILITRKRERLEVSKTTRDIDGRITQIQIEIKGKKINITNFYGYNNRTKRKRQIRELVIRAKSGTHKIIAGDFNGIDSCELDREPANSRREGGDARYNKKAMETLDVIDTFRAANKKKRDYTFHYPKGKARLDRIYTTRNIKTISCKHIPCPYTDHDAVEAIIQIKGDEQHGQTIWKNNTSIYEREDFQEELERKWTKWNTLYPDIYETRSEWWQGVKMRLKNLLIKYAKNMRKERKRREMQEEGELQRERSNLIANNSSQKNTERSRKKSGRKERKTYGSCSRKHK